MSRTVRVRVILNLQARGTTLHCIFKQFGNPDDNAGENDKIRFLKRDEIITRFLLVETLFGGNYSTPSESIYTTGVSMAVRAILHRPTRLLLESQKEIIPLL